MLLRCSVRRMLKILPEVWSTVVTYADIHDELRKIYVRSAEAKVPEYKASDFS